MPTAVERDATNHANYRILLDEKLPEGAPDRVRVIVLYDEIGKNGGQNGSRKAGSAEGQITMSDDFDEPLNSFEDYQP
ncbi:MAG: DUF2281 domain-containing protein [Pyrinomonadaceae bacterium]|nr:DUF2281 domain-containing protein [Pyrinomonadaceae bacterium]